ncbi:hypothetical protein, partial [Mesorhizobium sp. M4B.F.Ca.ET.215.01.1.1]|uniref:hypothetical protein n=1 Tax=Mesorhizobium sp. M4B.F.Ca.ET.215.01.1.1 TaxID=2563956 RepID=UPI001AEE3F44
HDRLHPIGIPRDDARNFAQKVQQSRLTNGKNRPRMPTPGSRFQAEKLTVCEAENARGRAHS